MSFELTSDMENHCETELLRYSKNICWHDLKVDCHKTR